TWVFECDTHRPSGTPLREGMATQYISMHIAVLNNLASRPLPRHPLSERGARRAGCVALSNRHSQTATRNPMQ
ncbi:MAG: hypothetical protein IKR79_07235, partial [Bacteroidales bacterium]|nr:hypothetical protein [Bacteroidales bacterium]